MRKKKRRLAQPDTGSFEDVIDLTPVVNVALILVVVFLCVSPMTLITGISASQSKTGVGIGKTSKTDNVRILLDKDRVIKINEKIIERENFVTALRSALDNSVTRDVMISADELNIVNDVVELLDISKQNGARKVIIMK